MLSTCYLQEGYISEMTASFLTTRFEIIPTPWALHPDSGVDELMEEDDDVLVDSSQGEGAAPVIPEEPIDEDGQPGRNSKNLLILIKYFTIQ